MRRFLLKYVSVGVIGAVFLWFGIPAVKVADSIDFSVPVTIRREMAQMPVQEEEVVYKVRKKQKVVFVDESTTPAARTETAGTVQQGPVSDSKPGQSEMTGGQQTESSVPLRQKAVSAAIGEGGSEPPRLAKTGDTASWGITCDVLPYYDTKGSKIGLIPGGVVVQCLEYREIQGINCLRVTTKEPAVDRTLRESSFLLLPESLVLMTGRPENLGEQQLTALRAFYTLEGRIRKRAQEMFRELNPGNPYKQEYVEANRVFTELLEEVKQLIKNRDAATGSEKIQLEDRLRELRYKQNDARSRLLDVQKRYRAWKERNPEAAAVKQFNPNQDEQIATMREEQQKYRGDLGNLVP